MYVDVTISCACVCVCVCVCVCSVCVCVCSVCVCVCSVCVCVCVCGVVSPFDQASKQTGCSVLFLVGKRGYRGRNLISSWHCVP